MKRSVKVSEIAPIALYLWTGQGYCFVSWQSRGCGGRGSGRTCCKNSWGCFPWDVKYKYKQVHWFLFNRWIRCYLYVKYCIDCIWVYHEIMQNDNEFKCDIKFLQTNSLVVDLNYMNYFFCMILWNRHSGIGKFPAPCEI